MLKQSRFQVVVVGGVEYLQQRALLRERTAAVPLHQAGEPPAPAEPVTLVNEVSMDAGKQSLGLADIQRLAVASARQVAAGPVENPKLPMSGAGKVKLNHVATMGRCVTRDKRYFA